VLPTAPVGCHSSCRTRAAAASHAPSVRAPPAEDFSAAAARADVVISTWRWTNVRNELCDGCARVSSATAAASTANVRRTRAGRTAWAPEGHGKEGGRAGGRPQSRRCAERLLGRCCVRLV
jgi:hypothetical protein